MGRQADGRSFHTGQASKRQQHRTARDEPHDLHRKPARPPNSCHLAAKKSELWKKDPPIQGTLLGNFITGTKSVG